MLLLASSFSYEKRVFSLPTGGRAVSFGEDHLIFVSDWGRLDGRQDSLITSALVS